jgi:hypothetical protein
MVQIWIGLGQTLAGPFCISNNLERPPGQCLAGVRKSDMTDDLTLGRLLGRREAFNIVAARCSAADAALLRQMREEKLYLGVCPDWDEFCSKHLHMRKSNANRIIQLLNEFGPQYFEVAQLTRISPETYRALAPSIRDGALHTESEAIALIPENAERVAAAVAELRKPAPKPAPDPIAMLRERCDEVVKRFAEMEEAGEHPAALRETLRDVLVHLSRIGMRIAA